jgi:hypothetical protein
MVRDRIQASQLVNRLEDHALNNLELSVSQIKAIEILLKKSLPDLTAVELTGKDGGPIETTTGLAPVYGLQPPNEA